MGKLNDMLAITLAASLAALGCTTNHNLGNGTPTRSGPEVRTAPTAGVTSGGETNTPPVNPPMTSSYNRSEILPSVMPRSRSIRRSPDEAAAIMAGRQSLHGRYLGVVSPGSSGGSSTRGYQSAGIRTYVNPAMRTNPQLTVNSSISSQPTEVITSGAEGTTAGTTAAATITADATPTTAAATVTATTTGTAIGSRTGAVASPVRIMRSTSGNVTVTNVGGTATGRNQ